MSTIIIITSPPPKPKTATALDVSGLDPSSRPAVETFHSRDEAIAYLQSLEE